MRAATRGDRICEQAPSAPAAKKTPAVVRGSSWKRRCSHSTSSDCTTKPPPKESTLNSADRRSTIERDSASGVRARFSGWTSSRGDRRV